MKMKKDYDTEEVEKVFKETFVEFVEDDYAARRFGFSIDADYVRNGLKEGVSFKGAVFIVREEFIENLNGALDAVCKREEKGKGKEKK